ncbi:hypothetical protein [Bartonella gliris]|uniref:hypothetical protein n=1 Tax=Bartonella gliris TaxID=3004109 RepID=UPI00295EE9B5|nr:hypothetical protein [Bartonella gliris]
MKKLYTTIAASNLKYSRFSSSLSGVVGVSLVAVAAFLSNVSLVFSANLDLTKVSLENVKNAAVTSPQSTLSAYNDYNSGMGSYNSVINVLTADGRPAWEDAQNIFRARGTVVSDARRNKRAKNALILDPEKYTAKEKSFVIDSMDRALGLGSIAISFGYDNQDGIEEYTFANGYSSRANADGKRAITIGTNAETRQYGKVILGEGSGTNSAAGTPGYDPFTKQRSTKKDEVWKSNASTATIGNYEKKITRQLEGVAAGTTILML